MDFKPGEIVAIIFALALPITVFAVAFTPGALGAVVTFMFEDSRAPWVFFAGALTAFAVLAWRIYRRIRPKAKPTEPEHQSPTHMPKV